MDAWPLFAVGMALLLVTLMDLFWTVIAAARGGGPVTALLTESLWRLTTRRGPDARHTRLELVGYICVVTVLLAWVLGLWTGLFLAFCADPGAVLVASTQEPAGALARAGYATGALAGAGAAYVAGSGGWALLNNVAAVLGLTVVTLAMTYLFQVVTATRPRTDGGAPFEGHPAADPSACARCKQGLALAWRHLQLRRPQTRA